MVARDGSGSRLQIGPSRCTSLNNTASLPPFAPSFDDFVWTVGASSEEPTGRRAQRNTRASNTSNSRTPRSEAAFLSYAKRRREFYRGANSHAPPMADASPADAGENWIPLESNPDVLTDFAHGLGVPQTSPYRFTDVWGLDEGVLAFMPRPVLAVVFLFPISESYESYRKAEDARIAQEGQTEDPELYFTKQTIGNACGTIGLLHALGNSLEELKVPETAPLAKLVKAARGKNPLERGKMLETSKELAEMHEAMGGSGQTAAPAADSDVNLHFVAFVQGPGNRRLYELDGRRPAPIDHGECEDLLAGAAKVVQRYIDREAGDLHFVLLALCSAEE